MVPDQAAYFDVLKRIALLTPPNLGMLELLAKKPKSGGMIKGTGGLRKVRIARKSGGKRGGTRVIYYYHNENKPILLLQIYAKADQEDLTDKQKKRLKRLVDELLDNFK